MPTAPTAFEVINKPSNVSITLGNHTSHEIEPRHVVLRDLPHGQLRTFHIPKDAVAGYDLCTTYIYGLHWNGEWLPAGKVHRYPDQHMVRVSSLIPTSTD